MNILPPIEIDEGSGFCFGVVNAIRSAERELGASEKPLYCLGDIVHNNEEVSRLAGKGLSTIDHQKMASLSNVRVLFRAHGEPPVTYHLAKRRGITIVDATCPVVLALQQRIRRRYEATRDIDAQIVIYGKRGHAEVNGLVGQTDGQALVIEDESEIDQIDFVRPVVLFSQTTKSLDGYRRVVELIQRKLQPELTFEHHDTICRQVANRIPHIADFAKHHDLILFVAGEKSSNGKILFTRCLDSNARSHFVSTPEAIDAQWLMPLPTSIGICGATSTPRSQMEAVADHVAHMLRKAQP